MTVAISAIGLGRDYADQRARGLAPIDEKDLIAAKKARR
jgi:hypothetical protein